MIYLLERRFKTGLVFTSYTENKAQANKWKSKEDKRIEKRKVTIINKERRQ